MTRSKVKKESIQEVVSVNTEEVVENIKETSIWLRLILVVIFFIITIFLIEKINFPSPEKKYDIDITNDIKKL